ncbi:hypothetical protein LTR06_008247 [Exophiala xenobiotica]|nr:hypothetical protein LTR06_008247 [Exophiala xenobiotica]
MSAQDEETPRVFLIRHGETEWSKNGRYTGITDLALLPEGEDKIPDLDWNLRNYVEALIRTTEDLAEWGYGDYEGLLTEQIRELRSSRGLDTTRPWQIMRDGCEGPGGEAPAQVEQRLDRIISKITSYQESMMEPYSINDPAHNVVLFGHGHILRAFVKRWLGFNIDAPIKLDFQFEPGSVCGLSYAHGDFNDRVLLAGMRFPVPPREDPDYDSDEHNYC